MARFLGSAVSGLVNTAEDVASGAVNTTEDAASGLVNTGEEVLQDAGSALVSIKDDLLPGAVSVAADPDAVLDVVGDIFNTAVGNIPIVGPALSPLFGFIWDKLTEKGDEDAAMTARLDKLVENVKNYVNEKLLFAKQQIVEEEMKGFRQISNDLKAQMRFLPDSAPQCADNLNKCVLRAREALNRLNDKEWAHITFQSYAVVASFYLALLDDGIKDKDKWGIPTANKQVYASRRATFFASNEFSNLLVAATDKGYKPYGMEKFMKLALETAELTSLWFCFNPQSYELGAPTQVKPSDSTPTITAGHIILLPPSENKCQVNNIPSGYVQQVQNVPSNKWLPYHPKAPGGKTFKYKHPRDRYPVSVTLRYYRLRRSSPAKHSFQVLIDPGEGVEVYDVDSDVTENDVSRVVESTEALLLWPIEMTSNDAHRGISHEAFLELVELKPAFTLEEESVISVNWKDTGPINRAVYLGPLEFIFQLPTIEY